MTTALKIESFQRPLELITKTCNVEEMITQSTENVFHLFGWNDLPKNIKEAIYSDVYNFSTELHLNFSAIDPIKVERKKRVCYWVNQFKAGNCSAQTAYEMLVVN